MEKCKFCEAEIIKTLTTASGVRDLTDCHNIFVDGEIYDERHITCYERQLAQQAELLREAGEVVRDYPKRSYCIGPEPDTQDTTEYKVCGYCGESVEVGPHDIRHTDNCLVTKAAALLPRIDAAVGKGGSR